MRHKGAVLLIFMLGLMGCRAATTPGVPPTDEGSRTGLVTATVAPPAATETIAQAVSATTTGGLTDVTLSVGFIPNVQFAPYYVAIDKGYYADQGLAVSMEYGFEHDFLQLLAAGKRQFVVASGDQVILARARGLPVRYVMTWHRRFPIAVFSLDPLDGPADLVGKTVGIPGLFGASYIGWQALLKASGINPDDIELEAIGFTQAEAVATHKVDAAVGYAVNEPIQLQMQGYDPGVILVADYIDLVANGIVTHEDIIARQPDLVQGMVTASLKGLRYTIDHPEEAFEMVLKFVPEAGEHREMQLMVLKKSIEFWTSDQFLMPLATPPGHENRAGAVGDRPERLFSGQLGYSDPAAWEVSQAFLKSIGMLEDTSDVHEMFTNAFVEAAGP